MKIGNRVLVAFGVAAAVFGASNGFAGFGLPLPGADSASASASGDASAMQDQLVQQYVAANVKALLGQAKLADALGLKDQAAEAQAKASVLQQGATTDAIKQATEVSDHTNKAVQDAAAKSGELSDEAKSKFADGLKDYAVGVVDTTKLKDAAINFQKSAKDQIANASVMQKLSVTKKLSAGAYVAQNLPGHIVNLGSGLKSAISFAQSHSIPVPADATAALSGL